MKEREKDTEGKKRKKLKERKRKRPRERRKELGNETNGENVSDEKNFYWLEDRNNFLTNRKLVFQFE